MVVRSFDDPELFKVERFAIMDNFLSEKHEYAVFEMFEIRTIP